VLRIEERAAQLPVLLSIPLVLFILPCTFMVLAGPAILQIIDALGKMTPIPH
jgi:tight adherence protein C